MDDAIRDCTERMLVIGAGPVGLAMANALAGAGIDYDHVESDDDLGGNWYHGVYETVHIVSSKKTTEFPDFPMPEDYPDFPSAQQMLDYLRDYAEAFNLRDRISFNTTVVYVRPVEHDLWETTFESGERRLYKGVIVCNGHHWDRRFPTYQGEFTGEWTHSKDYLGPKDLLGKRVLVIGGGNSGCDIVCEAARSAASAHLSLRRGYWFLPKTMLGRPTVELMRPWMPLWFQRILLRLLAAITVGDYRRYGLPRPDHRIFEAHPSVNTELLHYLKHGRISVHPDIERLDGDTVEFVDGTRETIDRIVCATGFNVSFPFLAEGLVEVNGPVAQLYAGTVSERHKHLYVLGTGQLRYGIGPVVTPYAHVVCEMIRTQDRLRLPLGAVLKAVGQRIPESHLVDPFQSLRRLRLATIVLPWLPAFERMLLHRKEDFHNEPIAGDPPAERFRVY